MQNNRIEDIINNENDQRNELRKALADLEKGLQSESMNEQQFQYLQSRITAFKQKLGDIQKPNVVAPPPPSLSLSRLDHLSVIFKHYCTHIFRTGKHMTFERLEYEKQHMTIDRFFIFLKDFKLTTVQSQSKTKEILSRNAILKIFKKVSSNGRQINFEQFIECIDRLAIAYFDENGLYQDKLREDQSKKKKKQQQDRQKAIRTAKILEEEVKKVRAIQEEKINTAENQKIPDKEQSNQDKDYQTKYPEIQQNKKQGKAWKELQEQFNVQQIKKPNEQQLTPTPPPEEQKSQTSHPEMEARTQQTTQKQPEIEEPKQDNKPTSFFVPKHQKIEAFYALIGIDSIKDYQKKLGQLNLPIFKQPARNKSAMDIKFPMKQSSIQQSSASMRLDEQSQRINEIKSKLEQQRVMAILKSKTPKKPTPATDQNDYYLYNQTRKQKLLRQKYRIQRVKKARQQLQQQSARPSSPAKLHPSFKQHKVTFNEIDQLNFQEVVSSDKQFHPHMLYNLDPEDQLYMGDLRFDAKNIEKFKMIEKSQRKAQGIVQSTRRRVSEIQKQEKGKNAQVNRSVNRRHSSSRVLA